MKIVKDNKGYGLVHNSRTVKHFESFEAAEAAMKEAGKPERVFITEDLSTKAKSEKIKPYTALELKVLLKQSGMKQLWFMRMKEGYSSWLERQCENAIILKSPTLCIRKTPHPKKVNDVEVGKFDSWLSDRWEKSARAMRLANNIQRTNTWSKVHESDEGIAKEALLGPVMITVLFEDVLIPAKEWGEESSVVSEPSILVVSNSSWYGDRQAIKQAKCTIEDLLDTI